MTRILFLFVGTLAINAAPAGAQAACWFRDDPARAAQRPSPPDSSQTTVAGATLKVCYSAPSANGRQIMGALVPLGEPWRLGANEATTILVPFPAEIAGVRVAPGAYTLYVIPSATTWEIVVNRSTQRWGTPLSPEVRAQDVGSGQVAVEARPAPAERLRLSFGPVSGNATELIVDWELTRVRIPVRRAEG